MGLRSKNKCLLSTQNYDFVAMGLKGLERGLIEGFLEQATDRS
jgi:hypothetical protein